jgi:hypothetical protein
MRSPYRRGPRLPQDLKAAPGRGKQPRWSEGRQGASDALLAPIADCFDWRPEVEIVVGPAKRRPAPFVSLPPDGGDA